MTYGEYEEAVNLLTDEWERGLSDAEYYTRLAVLQDKLQRETLYMGEVRRRSCGHDFHVSCSEAK